MTRLPLVLGLALAAAAPALAQQGPAAIPGTADATRVKAGNYKVDPAHTQVAFSVNHLGFNVYHGLFGDVTGTLMLDPARPDAAKLAIEIPLAKVTTTSGELNAHLQKADFLDTAKYPTATFRSTSVKVSGTDATITGDLTLHGVTKPVTLAARFTGAGDNPMSKTPTIGFEAKASIKRSEFGIAAYVPAVGDTVELNITAAFERQAN
jgi:polyisoprenoid-binding protein YceI